MESRPALRVMLVDDSMTIRKVGTEILEDFGCEVMSCTDGFTCIANAITFNPDIFMIDIMMPRLDGYQTVSLIRHKERFQKTPIFMLSSKDGIFNKAHGKAAGASEYITKPFTKEELRRAIMKHMGASRI